MQESDLRDQRFGLEEVIIDSNMCGSAIVSKGRMVVKKRDSTLDFYTKVIIVVCTLVKVYNMKKKTGLIVTVVSITSLYF